MSEGRESLTNRLHRQLAHLDSYVSLAGQNNLTSSHVVAESTTAGLLNRIYGWELINANTAMQNCPGVDLVDERNRIAVQVTATRTLEKVRHTLEEVGKRGVVYDELIILLLTHDQPTQGMIECTVPSYSGPMKVRNLGDLLRDAKELDVLRLGGLTEFLEAELGGIRERVKDLPHLELPPLSALPTTGFVGREQELAEIRSRFANGDKLVVLTGLGGMGKTELAVRYGLEHPGMVHFVRFDNNFTRTIVNMVHGIRPRLQESELRLEESILRKKVLSMLEQSRPEDLLIIDNADSTTGALADLLKDQDYKTIRDLPLRVLITTRSDTSRAMAVGPMPEEPLFEIFRNHGAELSKQEMQDLIRAVNGHTLTIDLIARTLNGKGWRKVTAEKMLTALREHSLREQKYRKIATDYNQSTEQAQIYEHLSVVFDLSGMLDVDKGVMRCASLLPEGGMDSELFGYSLQEEEQYVLDTLLERGWLEVKHSLLIIHPVIRLVCLTELSDADTDCEAFLNQLWTQYDQAKYLPDQYAQMAELFTMAHDNLGRPDGRWLNRGGILWNTLDQDQMLHDLYHPRLKGLEQALPFDSPELATAYNYYGIALGALGRYSTALIYEEKALAIRKAVLPGNDSDLARSYNNVGTIHGSLGDYRKALEYMLKAMMIFEEVLSADHLDLATSYIHVGGIYSDLGDHRQALKYRQKALAIREKILTDHPHLAASYNDMGTTYGNLGDYKCALEYKLKALASLEKVLPADHPRLAISYNDVGTTYSSLGDHKRALRYLLKALEHQEKVLPSDHPNLATSYNNAGHIYSELGNYHKALEYQVKALAIFEKMLPADHPSYATAYNNVGYTYGKLGNHHKELEYMQQALAIRENTLPSSHPDLALSCNNIAWTYYELRNLSEAALYMRRAADIISRSTLPKTHPNRLNYPQWADRFETEARMQQDMMMKLQQLPFPKK